MTNLTTPTPRLIAFIRRHWSRIRITVHTVLWLFTFGLDNYSLSIITPDDIFVRSWLTPGISLLTLTFFYVSGYIIFPRYLYVFRPVKLLISLALLFLLVHVCTYALLYYLHTYNPVTNNFINRYWFLFEAGGLFGCFTSVRIAIQDVILTSNVSFIYLVPKVAKDLVVILSRALQLEGDKFQLEGDNLRLERDNLNLELSFLKAQINPHFLPNTLNSVYARIFEADQQAANLILHLSELMRYNLYETDQPRIGLDKELAYVQNYLDLERNRLSGQDMLIDYEQSGEPTHYQIAPLLLIAFVENAFKHGTKGATQPAYVQVRAEVGTAGQFIFIVENSLPNRQLVALGEGRSGGVGLANVRRRLEALYAGQYSLDANTDQHTYMITLAVQLEQSSRTLPTAELA